MATQSVKIPVELEIQSLQGEVGRMRKMLEGLKPNTKAFDTLSRMIEKIDHNLISLENRSKQTFSSQGEINSFAKSFDKIGLAIQDVYSEFKRLDFKSLQFDDSEPGIQQIKTIEQSIEAVNKKIKGIDREIFHDFISADTLKTLGEIDDTFDPAVTSIEQGLAVVEKKIKEVGQAMKDTMSQLEKLDKQRDAAEEDYNKKNEILTKQKAEKDRIAQSLARAKRAKGNGNKVEHVKDLANEFLSPTEIAKINEDVLKGLKPEQAEKRINEFFAKLIATIQQKEIQLQKSLGEAAAAAEAAFDKYEQLELDITAIELQRGGLSRNEESYKQAQADLTAGQQRGAVQVEAYKQEIVELTQQIGLLVEQLRQNNSVMQQADAGMKNTEQTTRNATGGFQEATTKLDQLTTSAERLNNIQNAIKQWFGFNEVINLTKRAISDAVSHIRELDKVMTEIAVVTDMTQKELWDQISTYSDMAQKYGATTTGVYEVSQLYYQQGLQTAEVMQLTEETLKMAKIAGLDYADATDYMTVAIRGFKLEMSDAQNIVDVYSNIAAVTASDTEELAVAMSKTASSAEAVGSSFENTTAMIALMVETTREAPENIGSAMKSIISRYGEMTTNPAAIMDSEGEAMSLNKVDKALQSVGITLQDVNGQFRNFDEVILELSSKWDTIDKNTQRYIATVMAGNRQQSRFLALVGNYDRLSELYEEAANSQDAATLQTLKTMDSIETKINQLKTTFQEFYTNTGIEELIKGVLDFTTQVIERIDSIPKAFDKIPIAAIGMIGTLITTGKAGISLLMRGVFQVFDSVLPEVKVKGVKIGEYLREGIRQGVEGVGEETLKELNISRGRAKWGTALASIGSLVSTLALTLGDLETAQGRVTSGWIQIAGGAASAIGQVLTGNYIGAAITAVSTLTSAIATMEETTEEKIDRLKKNVEESSNESLLSKNELKTLTDYKKKYEELSKSQYESAEAKQEFLNLQNEIAEKYPTLISGMDEEGNYLVSLTENYTALYEAKKAAYEGDFIRAGIEQIKAYSDNDYLLNLLGYESIGTYKPDSFFPSFASDDALGAMGHYFEGLTADQWGTFSYQDLFANAYSAAALEFLGDGSEIETLFGVEVSKKKGFRIEGMAEYSASRGGLVSDSGTILDDKYYSDSKAGTGETLDILTDVLVPDILSEAARMLDEGYTLDEVNKHFQQYFGEDFYINEEFIGAIQELKANAELREDYLSKTIEALNSSQAMNIIRDKDLDLGALETDYILEEIQEGWEEYYNDPEIQNKIKNGTMTVEEAWAHYVLTIEDNVVSLAEDFIVSDNLFGKNTEKQIDTINAVYSSRETYSLDEYITALQEAGASDEVITLAVEKWNEDLTEIQTRFIEGIGQLKTSEEGEKVLGNLGTAGIMANVAPYLLDAVLSQFEYAMRNIETNSIHAEEASLALVEFYNALNELGPEAERIAANADLTSLAGIEAMFTEMETAGIDISGLDMSHWINTLTVNLDLEWETYSNKIAEEMKSFEKAITNASEGMDLEEATQMANKLGVSLNKFRFEDGKYFYDDLDSLIKAYQDFSNRLRTNLEEQTNQIKSFVADYNKDNKTWKLKDDIVAGVTGITDEGFEFDDEVDAELQAFLSSRFEAYQAWLNKNYKGESGLGHINEFILSELESLDDSTNQMVDEYQKHLLAMAALSAKNLSEFFKKMDLDTEEQAQILEALKTGDTSGLEGDALRIYYEYEDELTSLITSTISDMTDAALEAISSGKTQRVDITNLDKYNKELYDQISSGQLAKSGISFQQEGAQSYALIGSNVSESIYKQFLNAMNYTDEQYNETVVEFFNAKTKDVEGALDSVLSDVNKIDYSVIADFATAIGMTIDEILTTGIFALNPDKLTYRVQDFGRLEQEVQGKVTYAQEMIRDSISNYLDEVLGYVSNGISGSMSSVEFAQLQDFIHNYDEGLNLQFTETAEGLKLTQGSVLQVYSTLNDVDNLAAQVVLDELTESAMDSDESLNNIYKVMEKITILNKKIAEPGVDSARENALRAELALAENIRDTLMEAGDAFNFMDQDLPTGMTNPLSAWEGIGEAFNILGGDDFAANRIGFQDFYNMITMMGDDVLAAAGIFTNDSQTAADLIEAGAAALVNIDGETFVDLSKLGTNFNLGAEGMKEGLTEGIHSLAESQIDMLDAEIALLETIVQSQEAFDSVSDNNNEIEISELMPKFKSDGTYGWTTEQETILSTISQYIGDYEVKIRDKTYTWAEVLSNPALFDDLNGAQRKLIENLANIFNPNNIEWSGNTGESIEYFQTLVNQILAEYGMGIVIDPSVLSKEITVENGQTIGEKIEELITKTGFEIPDLSQKIKDYLASNPTEVTLGNFLEFITTDDNEDLINQIIHSLTTINLEQLTPEELKLKFGITTNVDGTYNDEAGNPHETIAEAYQANLEIQKFNKQTELINEGILIVDEVTGEVKYNGQTYSDIEKAYAAWQEDNTNPSTIKKYGTEADIEITPAKITIKTEGENGELIADDLETVKVAVTELILSPTEGGIKLAEETTPTIAAMKAVITAFTINPTATSLAEDANIDIDTGEGTATITVDKATIAALSADGVISENGTGGFKLNGTLAELEAKITELKTPANLVKDGDVYTLSGTTIQLSADVVSKLAEEKGILTPTEEGYTLNGTTVAEAELTVAQLASDGLLSSTNGVYTFTGDVKDIDLGINGDPAAATSAIQSIIDAYDNTDITLNVDIRVGDVDPVLNKYGLQTDKISSAAQTIGAGAQPETGMGFQSGIYASGSKDYGTNPKWVATTNSMYNETGWSKRGNKSVMTNTEDIINSYLSAIQSEIKAGKLITQEDVQVLNDLQTIANGFNGAESLAWFSTLQETLTLMESTSVEGNGLSATLTQIAGLPLETIVQAIADLTTNSTSLSTLSFENINNFITTLQAATGEDSVAQTGLAAIKQTLEELTAGQYKVDLLYNITSTADQEGTYNVNLEDNGTAETLTNLSMALLNLNTQANALMQSANAITSTGPDNVSALKDQMNILPDKSVEVGNTADAIGKLTDKSVEVGNTASAISKLESKSITASVTVKVTAPNPTPGSTTRSIISMSKAKGNVALAKGTGKAAAKGKTLMGELGPELYVTNGHYYVAGQNGAEFVDLPDDAIVFNHLQTQRLLSSGSSGRGDPVTNEKKAVAFAGGNVSGPAMASAESALAELKAIRAMWQALLDQDAKSLGKKAGSGGGGGGGGGGGSDKENAAYIHDLERWYNLLRQIEKLEEQITYEQAKRENMRNGYDYSKSLQKELELLKKQQKAYQDLSRLQKDYYEKRRQDLEQTDYSKIFTYDKDGLMQYVDGKGRGLDVLATLNATDVNGKAKMNASQQLAYLRSIGFNTSVLNTNVDGTAAESDEQRVQNFWDGIDGWMAEMDDLYDSYNEAATNVEEATQAMNEILQEYIDNQLAVEEKLMKAIEAREQAEIDRIQDEKDALDEAAQEYINGLNEALNKERDMYQKNETDAEIAKLQRQLAILQRSGGSTSEIKSLQDQIDSRLQDAYFQEQQDQINAIQEASDNQLEKLQTQIDLMTETLEYQKEHGLLWQEVYNMMNNWTPEKMLQFIQQNDPEYQSNSALQNQQNDEETYQQLQMWDDDKQNKERDKAWTEYYDALDYDEKIKEDNKVKAQTAYNAAYTTDGKAAAEAAANKVFEEAKTSNEQQNTSNSEPATPVQTEPPATLTGVLTGGNVNMRSSANTSSDVIKKITRGTTVTLTGMSSGEKNGYYWFKASAGGKTGYMAYTSRWGNFSGDINTLPKFAEGGLVDFTGPAWVDGSKSKPEAFLSAEDTAMLKSKIFSNSDGSLRALVAALEAITSDTSKYSAQTNTESIVIQNAQVNIQPGVISNDYDARRAGEMALEEMLKIARKTTNRVVSR